MKVIIPGGSGHLGRILADHFSARGDSVVILTRSVSANRSAGSDLIKELPWDAQSIGDWARELEGADVLINLTGRSVNCRYTPENRKIIKESRVKSTALIGEAIAACKSPPPLWLQMSTATIYAHRYDEANDEYNGIIGGTEADVPDTWRFSIDVARSWEKALDDAQLPSGIRRVKLRTSIVMSPAEGGPFNVLLRLVRYGLGGQSGNGKQFISWISDRDFVRAIDFLISKTEISDAVNMAAPNPVPNAEFMKELRQAWGIPFGLPAAEWMLELGAIPLQTETELILKSRRVVPARLIQSGFNFDFPSWDVAARDLCRRWRELY